MDKIHKVKAKQKVVKILYLVIHKSSGVVSSQARIGECAGIMGPYGLNFALGRTVGLRKVDIFLHFFLSLFDGGLNF
jgi:hypothetical protein